MTADMAKGGSPLLRKSRILGCTVFSFSILLSSAAPQAASATATFDVFTETVQTSGDSSSFLQVASSKAEAVLDHQDEYSGKEARKFVDIMATTALSFLADKSLEKDKKKKAFADLLNDSFDMKTIGRFSLGRYWRVSTKDQRREYLDLFQSMVINVYSERFLEYSGQKFETRGYRKEGEKDTIVSSFVIPEDGPEIQVDWRIRYKDGRFRVVDVVVEGVSMSMTQRSDFAAVIQRGGGNVSVLLDHLRNQ